MRKQSHCSIIFLLLIQACFLHRRRSFARAFVVQRPVLSGTHLEASEKDDGSNTNVDPVTKASWFAVEAFGKVFGKAAPPKDTALSIDQPPSSLKETQQRIQRDNEREYFLTGEIDKLIYAKDCTFADPFVSFQGRDRFVENLANLGSFITEYSAKPLSYEVDGNVVNTKFMVKLQLNLPWKPVLAWPWGVKCEIDPDTNLVTLHQESVGFVCFGKSVSV